MLLPCGAQENCGLDGKFVYDHEKKNGRFKAMKAEALLSLAYHMGFDFPWMTSLKFQAPFV